MTSATELAREGECLLGAEGLFAFAMQGSGRLDATFFVVPIRTIALFLLVATADILFPTADAQMSIVPTITTVAGNGTACAVSANTCGDGAAATSASLNNAQHVSIDGAGNLYISDNADNRVRKVSVLTGVITTVAGNGTQCASPTASCGDGGLATSANLYYPNATAVDAAGNLFIADRGDNRIRKVSATTGYISTVAGTGNLCANPTSPCGDGGLAVNANLNAPIDLALDGAGNLYIADYNDNRVRKVSAATGYISTVAGNGVSCSSPTATCGDGGAATSANLHLVRGIAFDTAGNGYISDMLDNRIRKINAATGFISTIAGNGTQCALPTNSCGDGGSATSANLYNPNNLAVDLAGNLYFSDYSDQRIRKISAATGIISAFAGNGAQCAATTNACGDGATAPSANFNNPTGIAIDRSGNIYISDFLDNRIRKVQANSTALSLPETSLTASSAVENVSLSTTSAETISSITVPVSQGGTQEYTLGTITGCTVGSSNTNGTICVLPVTFSPAYPGIRSVPLEVVTSAGNINFALTGTGRGPLAALTPGVISTVAGTGTACSAPAASPACGDMGTATSATLNSPEGVFVDSLGNVWVADTNDNRVREFSVNGTITTVAGNGMACASPTNSCGDGGLATAAGAELNSPRGVFVDGAGNLYIADYSDNRVREVAAGTQIMTTVAGTGTPCANPTSACGDGGAATSAQLNGPARMAMDGQGNLYIADENDNRIRILGASTGLLTTVAGTGTACASSSSACGDGASALLANLNSPRGVFVDSANNLYIGDSSDNRVRKVQAPNTGSSAGYITTVAGTGTMCAGGAAGCGDGTAATAAELASPQDVYVDSAGSIYIADGSDNRIRKVAAGSGYIWTITGNGTAGYLADGVAATRAELNQAQGLSLDSAGNLYLADTLNNRIRMVTLNQSMLAYPTSTPVGSSDSTDNPQKSTLSNIGNATLNIPPPGSGTNPSVAAYFALDAATTCAELTTASSTATLASGSDCTYAVDFEPTVAGSVNGSVVLTDSSLGASGSHQTISLLATATAVSTTTALSTSGSPSTFGSTVIITATVAPTVGTALPLGTVQFRVNGVATGSPVSLNSSGQAVFTTTSLATGTDGISAVYTSTSGNFTGSTSLTLNQVVSKASSSGTIIWATPSPITYGTALNSAQLNATSTLAGTFTYSPVSGTVLAAGSQTLTATFTPTDTTDFSTGTASVALTVTDATPTVTLTLSASTLTHGSALALTASVASGGTVIHPGVVTFCKSAYTYCTDKAVAGQAQLTNAGIASIKVIPPPGTDGYYAVYAPAANYAVGTSSIQSVTVSDMYTTATTFSDSGSGGNYTLTSTVASSGIPALAPTGTVSFEDTSNVNYVVAAATPGSATVTQTFTAGSSYATTLPRDVAVADFNGDGVPDLAVVDQGEALYIYLGHGDGTFAAASGSPITVGADAVGVVAGDFNNDGKVDLVVSNWGANTISILLGNGNGTFQTPATQSVLNGPQEIKAADFNNDGNLDLVIAGFSPSEVEVLFGNGTGAFPTTSTFSTGSQPFSLSISDFNNDGNLDIATGNSGASSVTILLGNGAGGFTQPVGSPFEAGSAPSSLVAGGFRNNGKIDLVVSDSGASTIDVLLGNGDGTFGPPASVTGTAGQQFLATGDFNGDGKLDFAVVTSSTGSINVYTGNGDGTFKSPSTYSAASTSASYIASADFNGDGLPDLVVPMQGNNKTEILLNSTTQTVTASVSSVNIPGTGSHNIEAAYSGDTYNATSTSSKIALTASLVTTTLTLQASPTSSTFGTVVTLTATLSPYIAGGLTTAGQTVTFKSGSNTLGTGTLAGGIATLSLASLPTGSDILTASYLGDTNFHASITSALPFTVNKATPTITWSTPAALAYGTALSSSQLDATSGGVAGTFVYSPASGTILTAGSHTLSVTFTPTDTTDYSTASGSVTLTVNKTTPTLSLATSGSPSTYGGSVTFTATVSSGPSGTVTFLDGGSAIGTGTISGTAATFIVSALTAGSHAITASLAASTNYNSVTSSATIQTVSKATPAINWTNPWSITYGMELTSAQLNASSGGVAGTFAYTPGAGTVLSVGSQTLSVTFTPTDGADYNTAGASVTLTVDDKVTPTINWSTPSPISYGTALSVTQLNASAVGVAGTMSYSPGAGTIMGAGAQTLSVTFTPSDSTNYNSVMQTVLLTVNKASVVISGSSSLTPSVYGDTITTTFTLTGAAATPTGTVNVIDGETTLSIVPLSAGVVTYTTPVLTAGSHTLKVSYNGDDNYE